MAIDEKAIFVAALALTDANERDAYLEQACAGDPALLNRVKQLLSAHEESQGPLDRRPPPLAATATFNPPDAAPGAVIGPYKLLQQIGEGGMGTVFMAEQTQPVRRKVALKIIKPGMDTRQVIARFEAERQALALMDHANIARVLDAGTTERGRPYFVMDLVKGVPITKYCDEQHLTPRQRLELFIPVCQAIQHAHQKGIIHRDLKPSNVLVALYDGKPVPKVIDFGVAKAIGQPLTEQTLVTGFGAIVGTLEYMSPEQAELNQLDIDTRSDIYSLGVLLYELLTGSPPFTRKELEKAGMLEMLRVIREQEPSKPSTKLSSSDALPTLAANRGTEPAKLTKLVRGELDWIVMKCLEKDRHRRYESASAFAADVQRYLADEPVQACPPSAGYRLRKFVRRHRGPVLAAATVVLVLVAGIIGTTWGLIEARRRAAGERLANLDAQIARQREADRAEEEAKAKRLAQQRLAQIEKANDLLVSIFRNLDPRIEEKQNKPIRAILGDRLEKAAQELEGEAVGDPVTVARLQNNLGLSLAGLGRYDQAMALLEKARHTREELLGPDHADTLKTMHNLGDAYRLAGKFDKALPLFAETLARTKAKLGPDHPDTLHDMNSLAVIYWESGRLDLALPLYQEVLAGQKAKLGPGHHETLITMNNLAVGYQEAGRFPEACALLEEVLRQRKDKVGPDHADTLQSQHNLAMGYHLGGRRDEARALFEDTLARRRSALGPDHPATLMSINALAGSYQAAGWLDKAMPLYAEAFAGRKAKLGPDHPHTLNTQANLAGAYCELGRLNDAIPLFEEVLALTKKKLGPDHPGTLANMADLAVAYRDAGRLKDAIPLFEETLDKQKAKLGADNPRRLVTMHNLALAYQNDGRRDRALTLLEETLPKQKAKLGPDHPDTLTTMTSLADAYLGVNRAAEAETLLRDCLAGREKKQPEAWATFHTKSLLGAALLAQNKYADAEPLLLAGYEGLKQRHDRIPAREKRRLSDSLQRLVELYDAWGKKAEAEKWRRIRSQESGVRGQGSAVDKATEAALTPNA